MGRRRFRVIRGGKKPENQLFLFREGALEKRVTSLLKPRTVDLLSTAISPDYNVNEGSLKPFFSKVTIGEDREAIISHRDHFYASQKTHFGVYVMESHRHGIFTGEYGVPHEVLISLSLRGGPSEVLSIYLGGYEVKAMNGAKYRELLQSSFDTIVTELVRLGMQYNAIRIMRRKEDKISSIPIPSLSWRLSRVSDEVRREFHRAFESPLNLVRDPYRTEMAPKENPEIFHYNGIDTYVGKLISIFQQLYALKIS